MKRKQGGGPNPLEPPRVYHIERDIENQLPIKPEVMRVKRKTYVPTIQKNEVDEIDIPTNEVYHVKPQQKTSIIPIANDIETSVQNDANFSGLEGSDFGQYDNQFFGGKKSRSRKMRSLRYRKKNSRRKSRKMKTKGRKNS